MTESEKDLYYIQNNNNSNSHLSFKCNMFGKMFARSRNDGYDSFRFIKEVMNNERLEEIIFMRDDSQNWCDNRFLYDTIKEEIGDKFVKGPVLDEYELWFMGYLYKYWINNYFTRRQTVYKLLPPEKFDRRFGFYHTQGWDYIIHDVLNETYYRK